MEISDLQNKEITLRLLMQGKEVGYIIGRNGETIKRVRQDSGAWIRISNCATPDRIVTVTGSIRTITKAIELIIKAQEEILNGPFNFKLANVDEESILPTPPITIQLILLDSLCGLIIGKGGSKIQELREQTRASIQIASEFLPYSNERAITISGQSGAITNCITRVCEILVQTLPNRIFMPYVPRALPTMPFNPKAPNGPYPGVPWSPNPIPLPEPEGFGIPPPPPFTGFSASGFGGSSCGIELKKTLNPRDPDPLAALSSLVWSQLRTRTKSQNNPQSPSVSSSSVDPDVVQDVIRVPNEMIGFVIGKHGTKIAQIRSISKAVIWIGASDTMQGKCKERMIKMIGRPDAVALAKSLINTSIKLQKEKNLEKEFSSQSLPESTQSNYFPNPNPTSQWPLLANLLSNPQLSGSVKECLVTEVLSFGSALAFDNPSPTIPHHSRYGSNCNGLETKAYSPRVKSSSGTADMKSSKARR